MLYKTKIEKLRMSKYLSLGAITSLAISSSLYADTNTTANNMNSVSSVNYQPVVETNIVPTTKFKTVEIKDNGIIDELPRYQPGIATVGKTKQSVHETPQAITVVTKELLADQAKFTLKEAMTNVAGLTFNAAEGGRIGDNMNLRGFYTFGDLYLDGIRDVSQYNRDTFNLESVDVLRGGAAMLYGRGQAGGVISQQSKVAKAEDFGKLSLTAGENDFARYSADVNQMISDTTAVRVNLMNQSGGSTRDDVLNESTGMAPSIAFGLGTNNEFSISHLYQKTNLTPDYGVPFYNKAPLDVDPSTYYGFKEDYEANKVNMTTVNNLHKFADGSELKTTLRQAKYLRDNWAIAPSQYNETTRAVGRSLKGNGAEETVKTLQNDFTTNFEALGVKHSVLAGNEILLEEQTRWGHTGISSKFPNLTTTTGATDTYGLPADPDDEQRVLARNGIYYQYVTSGTNANKWVAQLPNTLESSSSLPDAYKSYYGNKDRVISGGYEGKTIAFYAQDTIELTPELKLMAGMRHDRLKMDYLAANLTKNGDLKYNENSYRAGLSYEPNANAHYYLSWNNSFNTTGDLYSFSGEFDPEKSITYELGSKWQLFEGDLALRTSLYRTIKEWERNTDVASASANPILTKERHTDGFEIEAAGRVTQDLEIFAAYTKMQAEVDKVAPGKGTIYEGKRPPNATDYTYNAWLTYKLNRNWKIGGGLEGKGDRYVYSYGTPTAFAPNIAPSYIKGDAMVTYTKKDYDIQLNIKNITDKTYYDAAYINGGFIIPGNGRTATVTLNYKF